MSIERTNFTEQEKLAQRLGGAESDRILPLNSERDLKKIAENEARSRFNDEVEKYNEDFNNQQKVLAEATAKLSEKIEHIECKPLFEKIHVVPYATNPFQKMKKEGGLIIDTGGLIPEDFSHESGKMEKEEPYIIVGDVVEIGPEVKYIKPGDTVMYIRPNQIPVPLYNTGIMCISERSIVAVINDGLNKRFNEISNEIKYGK